MSTIRFFAFALCACTASFTMHNASFAQSGQRPYDNDYQVESLEIIPNANSLLQRNYRAQTDNQPRPHSPVLRDRELQTNSEFRANDYARRPAYRQPYRATNQLEPSAEHFQRSPRFGDRDSYEMRRAQFAQDGRPATNLPEEDYARPHGGRRGCQGGSCGQHRRHHDRNDGDPRLGNEGPPFAEPPYLERGPSNQNGADLPPQLGIYRPIQSLRYRN